MVKRVLVVLVLLALVVTGFGQARPARKLMARDVVRIAVFNQPQIQGDATIDAQGYITPPFLRPLLVEGKTIEQVINDLTRLYVQQFFLKNPIVSVTLLTQRPMRATIGGGGVPRAGTFEIFPGDNLLSLLNQGGGAIRDVADLRRAYLRRAGTSESIPIDLYSLTVFGDVSQNYELQDGDELIVPESRGNQILVLGAVQSPGLYPFREPTTALDAIGEARGEIRLRSRFSRTVVLRKREGLIGEYVRIPIDLVRFVRKGDSTQNIQLQPGDIVFVPETNTPDFGVIAQLSQSVFLLQGLSQFFGLRGFR